ncbi:BTAD domain-containing putative transcriptional regulator [Streptomyces sp. NPDC029554]|uniref:BTAD domain-containing putative transcriptional regulator n=1 Tax=Streptomyces sp. NPDC029554 TaxID=3155126 RepID=UPI0033EDBBC3
MFSNQRRASAEQPASDQGEAPLRFSVLGPVRAWRSGKEVDLGSPQQRAVLAVLLIQEGRSVSIDHLIHAIWGDTPPLAAVPTLRTYISRLRRVFEADLSASSEVQFITSTAGGYAIPASGSHSLDLTDFEAMVLKGRRLNQEGSFSAAVEVFTSALNAWQGSPFEGVPGPFAHKESMRLMEQRMNVLEERLELNLRLGRHADVVAELTALCAEYPLREQLHALLMLALYRCGRQAEALSVYQDARKVLVDELGVEPGPQLREIHSQLLAESPLLAFPEPAHPEETGEESAAEAPAAKRDLIAPQAQLPPGLPVFAGRKEQLQEAVDLASRVSERSGPTIGLVTGTAGVGKTSFAVHWAHRVANIFPDGHLYLDLRGFSADGQPKSAAEAVRVLLESLGVAAQRMPAHPDAQVALYRSILADRRLLIVLDNARDAQQVRPLLAGGPSTLIIVTSRVQLTGLIAGEGAHLIHLEVLSHEDALDMLEQRLGPQRIRTERSAALDVIACCAQLPLAIAIVAARAAARPRFPLADLVRELRSSAGNLDSFDDQDPALDARSVFSWSYAALNEPAAHLFRLLALHPGSEMSIASVASLADVDVRVARRLLRELCEAALIAEIAPGRFAAHDLLLAYANELISAVEAAETQSARSRLISFYVSNAHAAADILNRNRSRIDVPPPLPGVISEKFDDYADAFSWSATEHPVLLEVIASAMHFDMHSEVWHLAHAMETYLQYSGRWHTWIRIQLLALAAAEKLDNSWMRALARLGLSKAHSTRGEHELAQSYTQAAMLEFRKIGNRHFEGQCYVSLGINAGGLGKHTEAVENYKVALGFFSETENPAFVATILNNTGNEYICLSDFEQAIRICEQAIPLWSKANDRYGLAHTWDCLGQAHHKMGHYGEATTAFKNAIDLFQKLGSDLFAATSLSQLGDVYASSGNHTAAYGAWRMALDSLEGSEEDVASTLILSLNAKLQEVTPARLPHRKS